MDNAWTVPDHFGRFSDIRKKLYSPIQVDHHQEQRVNDRMYQRERDCFEYQCQQDRFSN